MLARSADADVIVVGLVGERGREVREFVERDLGQGLQRSVVVVATGDEPPLVRVRAAMAAPRWPSTFATTASACSCCSIRSRGWPWHKGKSGLAAGEPPTARGYPPSVFALLPRLVERAGNVEAWAASPPCTPLWPRVMILPTRWSMPRARAWMATSYWRANWRNGATSRRRPARQRKPGHERYRVSRPSRSGAGSARGFGRVSGDSGSHRGGRVRRWHQSARRPRSSLHQ